MLTPSPVISPSPSDLMKRLRGLLHLGPPVQHTAHSPANPPRYLPSADFLLGITNGQPERISILKIQKAKLITPRDPSLGQTLKRAHDALINMDLRWLHLAVVVYLVVQNVQLPSLDGDWQVLLGWVLSLYQSVASSDLFD